MHWRLKLVEYLAHAVLEEARAYENSVNKAMATEDDPPTLPPYWTVVLVLLEEVVTVLLEKPEGRHGSPEDLPF